MVIYLIGYIISFLLASHGFYLSSGSLCILTACYLYYYDYSRSGDLLHLRGIFSLFWLGGQGVACFKLSHLQTDWNIVTWISFFAVLFSFWLTFEAGITNRQNGSQKRKRKNYSADHCLLFFIVGITAVSSVAFLLEAVVLGFIPFFMKGVPHAYSEFHISGVHYFTVSCVLVPALTVLYALGRKTARKGRDLTAAVCCGIAFMIPILCVSRFQLILAVLLAIFTYISVKQNFQIHYVIGAGFALVPLYLILTIARSHDIAYLNGIFEMKYEDMPIFITQPYMYIANNYDNFNCLVELLPTHSFGMRMLFPVWALSGMKFLYPDLVNYNIYVNKPELTTLTLIYDAYYDFGIIGVVLFGCILGAAACLITRSLSRFKNPISYLFYAQLAVYLMLSFFTTWFSNPATWFYFAITGIVWVGFWFYQRKTDSKD